MFNVNKRTKQTDRSFMACCGCFVVASFLAVGLMFLLIGVSGSGKVYEGRSKAEIAEKDNFYVEQLSEYGVVLDVENRLSNDYNSVIDKVMEGDGDMIDKIEAIQFYGAFVSVYYVENDQETVSNYVNLIKSDIDDGSFFDKVSDDRYILEMSYMGAVIDKAIPHDETNENLINIDKLTFDNYAYFKAYVRGDVDRADSLRENLVEGVEEVRVPVIED